MTRRRRWPPGQLAIARNLGPREADFTVAVMAALRAGGCLVMHITDSRRPVPGAPRGGIGDRDVKGYPDLTIVRSDFGCMWRELKVDGGRLTPEQRMWLMAMKAAGLDAGIWTPDDWPTIDAIANSRP